MPLRFSGKVSGILDDLSDAMSMLHDLLPSAGSDVHLQVSTSIAFLTCMSIHTLF